MAQLTYPDETGTAYAGMLADMNPRAVDSRSNEEAGDIPYGVAVVAGTDPDVQALLPTGAATLLGVALHSHANEVGGDNANDIPSGAMFSVLADGRVYVLVEEAVTPASSPFVRISAGAGGTQLGAFRASADTASALAVTGARFKTSAGAGGYAVLEIDKGASIA